MREDMQPRRKVGVTQLGAGKVLSWFFPPRYYLLERCYPQLESVWPWLLCPYCLKPQSDAEEHKWRASAETQLADGGQRWPKPSVSAQTPRQHLTVTNVVARGGMLQLLPKQALETRALGLNVRKIGKNHVHVIKDCSPE